MHDAQIYIIFHLGLGVLNLNKFLPVAQCNSNLTVEITDNQKKIRKVADFDKEMPRRRLIVFDKTCAPHKFPWQWSTTMGTPATPDGPDNEFEPKQLLQFFHI